jgi:hypothetical protein
MKWVMPAVLLATHCFFLNQYPNFITPNVLSRFYTALAIVDDGSLSIDGPIERYQDVQDKALYQGRYFSDKPPGYAVALTPLVWGLRTLGLPQEDFRPLLVAVRLLGLSLPIVAFWIGVLPFYTRITRRESAAAAVVLCGALGTSFFIYATQLFSGSAAGALLFGSYWLVIAQRDAERAPRWPAFLAAGFLAGLAFTFDFIVMPAVPILLLFAWLEARRREPAIAFGAGLLFVLLLWMAHNLACFDHVLRVGFHFEADPHFASAYSEGWRGMRAPSLDAALGLSISPMRGLFFLSPALLFALWGFARLVREPDSRRDAGIAACVFAAIFAFATTTVEWHGGWSVGPRYLVPGVPFLLVGLAGVFRGESRSPVVPFAFSALNGVGIVGVGIAASSFAGFPTAFSNPIYHFALSLLEDGFHTSSLLLPGSLQGLAIPIYIGSCIAIAAYAAWLAVGGYPRRWALVAGSCALSGLLMLGLASIPEPAESRDQRESELARILWNMGYVDEAVRRTERLRAERSRR